MDETRQREIRVNWERALESLDAAQDLLVGGHPDFAASHAYYATLLSTEQQHRFSQER
jgi:uncharacterized protein (UPF0332 family)